MAKLIREDRDFELRRHKAIILETIDYILRIVAGEDHDQEARQIISDYYSGEKEKIEKHFRERRLSVLQKRLVSITTSPMYRADITFNQLIKDRTGYEI